MGKIFFIRVVAHIPSKSKSSAAKKPKGLKETKKVEDISPAFDGNSRPSPDEHVLDDEKEKMS